MQCPACNHEASPESFGDPAKCPTCGVYYDKALALKKRRESAGKVEEEEPKPERKEKLKSAWEGAKVSVEEGRRRRAEQEAATARQRSPQNANGVVVIDIKMSFWSMVVFMVKWAIASIPAMIILFVLGSIAWGIVLGLSTGFSSPPRF